MLYHLSFIRAQTSISFILYILSKLNYIKFYVFVNLFRYEHAYKISGVNSRRGSLSTNVKGSGKENESDSTYIDSEEEKVHKSFKEWKKQQTRLANEKRYRFFFSFFFVAARRICWYFFAIAIKKQHGAFFKFY